MNIISYTFEEIEHAGTEDEEGWTARILHITIESNGYEEMMEEYHFLIAGAKGTLWKK